MLTCRTCHGTKPLEDFDVRADTGGRRTECKECRRRRQRRPQLAPAKDLLQTGRSVERTGLWAPQNSSCVDRAVSSSPGRNFRVAGMTLIAYRPGARPASRSTRQSDISATTSARCAGSGRTLREPEPTRERVSAPICWNTPASTAANATSSSWNSTTYVGPNEWMSRRWSPTAIRGPRSKQRSRSATSAARTAIARSQSCGDGRPHDSHSDGELAATRARLELAAPCFVGKCSIH
jgi:hypothetical protein